MNRLDVYIYHCKLFVKVGFGKRSVKTEACIIEQKIYPVVLYSVIKVKALAG